MDALWFPRLTLAELLVLALAVWEACEVWHHSTLMATWRARLETGTGFIADVSSCMFCLSVWIAFFAVVVFWPLAPWVVWTLAAARLANLGNDLTKAWCRTPGSNL